MKTPSIRERRNTEGDQEEWVAFFLVPASEALQHAERNIGIVIKQTGPEKNRNNGCSVYIVALASSAERRQADLALTLMTVAASLSPRWR